MSINLAFLLARSEKFFAAYILSADLYCLPEAFADRICPWQWQGGLLLSRVRIWPTE
jgi:hypothetical protein